MKKTGKNILFALVLLFTGQAAAYENVDSLINLLPSRKQDSLKVKEINRIAGIFQQKGDFERSLEFCTMALKLADSLHYKRGLSYIYNYYGVIYKELGDFPKSVSYLLKSLGLKEEMKDAMGVSTAYINIGNVFFTQDKFNQALDYYYKALRLGRQHNFKSTIATCHGNIGIVFNSIRKLDSACWHYEQGLRILTALNDRAGMSGSYANIGVLRWDQGKLDEALQFMFKAEKISEELGNKVNMIINYINIGEVYIDKKESAKGIDFILKGIELARKIHARDKVMLSCQSLSEAYKRAGNFGKALEYYDLYMVMKDSLMNEDNDKNIAEMQARYDADKKQREIVLLKKDRSIQMLRLSEQQVQASRQQIAVWSFSAIGLLLLLLTFFVFRSFLQKRKANLLLSEKNNSITAQKRLIEQKNRQITSSIDFARKMQETIFPPVPILEKLLDDHFIFFLPKDIVSGDFYWLGVKGQGIGSPGTKVHAKLHAPYFIAAIDCTGHGVPGALMSLHAHDMLEKINGEKNICNPAVLLDELNEAIKNSIPFRDDAHAEKFGMDMAVVSIDKEMMELHYAGARNPAYIIRDKDKTPQLIEIKADRVSIGSASEKFTNHEVSLEKGDMIYIFSDGYADQVGGPNRKKFLSGNFKELLLSIAHFPVPEQKNILARKHAEWKNNFSQTDDIMVIGIRI